MLSKACQYAVKAMIYIGTQPEGSRATLREVAAAIESPEAFTSKILQKLTAAGLIHSIKGLGGGFALEKAMLEKTTIEEILQAVDCDSLAGGCILGLAQCSDANPCPVHHRYAPIRNLIYQQLWKISLAEIISDQHFAFSLRNPRK